MGVPCYTLRANTERPVTITTGRTSCWETTRRPSRVPLTGAPPTPCAIPLWDGHAAERAADALDRGVPRDRAPRGGALA